MRCLSRTEDEIADCPYCYPCNDVSIPWHSQPFAFLENNSFPAFDPQQYPSTEEPVDVAQEIWDFVLCNLDTISGTNGVRVD